MSPGLARAFGLALLAFAGGAQARSAGVAALGCEGCHSGGQAPTVALSADPLSAAVGEPVTLTVTISQTNGPTAGFYLTTAFDSPGRFQIIEPGTAADSSGVLHTTPRSGAGGSTTFKVQWVAAEPTGVAFDAYALSANGDRSNRGDGAGVAHLQLVVGCSGSVYYIDQDGDGFGSVDPAYPSRRVCERPPGYAAQPGDCDDFRAQVYPGALEQCDLRDNDCNGEVDDDVVSQVFCEDKDGDGHGVPGRRTVTDCKPLDGFGNCDGDCDDGDAHFYPGAPEVCDLRDNDCDGETDEGVRPRCGVGLCARNTLTCDVEDCTPGDPFPETCNGYDDDCDGVVDNAAAAPLCPEIGASCVSGKCVGEGSGGGGKSGSEAPAASGAGGRVGSVSQGSAVTSGCSFGSHRAALSYWLVSALAMATLLRRAPSSRRAKRNFSSTSSMGNERATIGCVGRRARSPQG